MDDSWIRISERLPEKEGRYLICEDDDTPYPLTYECACDIAFFTKNGNDRCVEELKGKKDVFWDYYKQVCQIFDAKFWMPLPAPPKEWDFSGRR